MAAMQLGWEGARRCASCDEFTTTIVVALVAVVETGVDCTGLVSALLLLRDE